MKQYQDMLSCVLNEGRAKDDRTGTGTIGVHGHLSRFNLAEGFPLVTVKKTNLKAVWVELLWFLRGRTDVKFLNDRHVHIWDEWQNNEGGLGPIYGKQWRSWQTYNANNQDIDQITQLITNLKDDPFSRRHIVSAWNVGELEDMQLPPCHILFQMHVHRRKGKNYLDCQVFQRSADLFLGVPFNIASYATLTHILAHITGYTAGDLIYTLGDMHLYNNHLAQSELALTRNPLSPPTFNFNPEGRFYSSRQLEDLQLTDFNVNNYNYHPYIKAEISV